MRIASAAKSIVAGIAAGATAAVTAIQDGVFDTGDGVTVVLAMLAAWGVTWAVPNRPNRRA
ncbi:hypothetical protein [Actinacidiphila glaucinigra]|uniref:hypothetical protein n=1 Tax=Actinacidiphila glaucinigra TaxID=235986 RepID=UPI0035DBBE3B